LTRYRDDGHLEIDNNAAERSLRAVALGRNYVQRQIMCSDRASRAVLRTYRPHEATATACT
jgi:hypothetical protein